MATTKRVRCPHCKRPTAVIGAQGQLARHRCPGNPATMTPAELVAASRREVSSALSRRTYAAEALRGAEQALRWNARWRLVVGVALAFALLTVLARPGTFSFVGLALAAVSMWTNLLGRFHGLNALDTRRRRLAAVEAEYDGALTTLVEVESAVPDHIAWPEIFPSGLPDLDDPTNR